MGNAALLALIFAANYLGFACLALSQQRHWTNVVQQPLASRARVLRGTGFALLISSYGLSIQRDGWSFGSILWCTSITLGAIAVAFTLAVRPNWLRPVAVPFRR